MGDVTLIRGDCLGVMPTLPDGSVDAIVTDPPAGIRMMGMGWDTFPTRGRPEGHAFGDGRSRPGISKGQEYRASDRKPFVSFMTGVFVECLRIARPGSRCLVWAIPRTSHWTATAIEDAGWIIEDRVSHLFGQGMPKARSRLKPSCEDWWLARKPSKGVPPLNIDACRIAWDAKSLENDTKRRMSPRTDITGNSFGKASGGQVAGGYVGDVESPVGRWPANVVLSHHPDCRWVGSKSVKSQNPAYRSVGKGGERPSGFGMGPRPEGVGIGHAGPDGMETVEAWDCVEGCPIAILDEQSGVLKSGGKAGKSYQYEDDRAGNCYGDGLNGSTSMLIADSGGASRFYYCPKASSRDRGDDNNHPTVKSTDLMSWLVRLIARPGETVLDPFMGSGSTGKAAMLEGCHFIGIESHEPYYRIAERRIAAARAEAASRFPFA